MPYIINKEELLGLHAELESAVADLQAIWDDKQYQYFCDKYAEPLVRDLKGMEDKLDDCVYRIYNLQSRLESL